MALGLGTMVGWKRIVVTVGEKIGKDHLISGQGAAAENYRDGDHRHGGLVRSSGESTRRLHGGTSRRAPVGHSAQPASGLGVDIAGFDCFWRASYSGVSATSSSGTRSPAGLRTKCSYRDIASAMPYVSQYQRALRPWARRLFRSMLDRKRRPTVVIGGTRLPENGRAFRHRFMTARRLLPCTRP
jgi:hypothetical protein